jgi:hypothetical protein
MKFEIDIDHEQMAVLIRNELAQAYDDVVPENDHKLLAALETVLEFYMSPRQFQEWKDGLLSSEE